MSDNFIIVSLKKIKSIFKFPNWFGFALAIWFLLFLQLNVVFPQIIDKQEAMAFLTSAIALFGLFTWLTQLEKNDTDKRVANANYQLALFDKRLEAFLALRLYFAQVNVKGEPETKAFFDLMEVFSRLQFLLPKKQKEYFYETIEKSRLYRAKHQSRKTLIDKQKHGTHLSVQENEKMKTLLQEMYEIQDWTFEQFDDDKFKVFDEILNMPEDLY